MVKAQRGVVILPGENNFVVPMCVHCWDYLWRHIESRCLYGFSKYEPRNSGPGYLDGSFKYIFLNANNQLVEANGIAPYNCTEAELYENILFFAHGGIHDRRRNTNRAYDDTVVVQDV